MTAGSSYQPYSWHQSHDQATVLLVLPYEVVEGDVQVIIDGVHLVAGVLGQPPLIKGLLYAPVHTTHSDWLLEPTSPQLSVRERTTSTTSTASTHSSYAVISSEPDIEITSSFPASLASGSNSEDEATSPVHSSPHTSADERAAGYMTVPRRRRRTIVARSGRITSPPPSLASSQSSINSVRRGQGRLLTLHLEKAESSIWPALIVGPAPVFMNSPQPGPAILDVEAAYNMDPTSLALLGLELADVRNDAERAFECFLRSWLHARVPSAAMRLVTHYIPPLAPNEFSSNSEHDQRRQYYIHVLGGSSAAAQLYLTAGLLHLEGTAASLLASSHAPLASIRLPEPTSLSGGSSTTTWKRDRAAASLYFERARALAPELDVPFLLPESQPIDPEPVKLEMPVMDPPGKRELTSIRKAQRAEAVEGTWWYLYVPGIVGAGTALLVVSVVGAISLSNWRRNQS